MLDLASCRSLLFVPAHVQRFVEKAHTRGADVIVLDLEDSVPTEQKAAAREQAAQVLPELSRRVPVIVRVNSRDVAADVAAVVGKGASGLLVPKVESRAQVEAITKVSGKTPLIVQIESVDALPHLDDIASTPGVVGLNLGAEDFSVSTGGLPTWDAVLLPLQLVLYAARRARIAPIAPVISDYGNREEYRELMHRARALGYRGALCVHPDQITICNEEYSPSQAEIDEAAAIVAAYESAHAEGRGAASLDGLMIDAPVVARARALLEQRR